MGLAQSSRHTQTIPPDNRCPAALYWLALGVFVLLATASLFLYGPQIQVDEGSYLLTAATMAGKLSVHGVYGYYSGYSLLLVPAFLFGSSPDRIYHVALVINALLLATTPLALFRLTRMLHAEVDPRWHVAAAIAATCYAPLLLISQHAMSENALVPLYAWLLATGASAAVTTRAVPAVCCGIIAGALLLVHPRGAAIAAPVIATLCVFGVRRPDLRRAAIAMLFVAVAVAALHSPLEHLAAKHGSMSGAYPVDEVVGRLASPTTWFWVALNFLGTATEAMVASLGLFGVAVLAIAMDVWPALTTREESAAAKTAVSLAAILGMVSALFMSAIFFIPPQRADQIAYGRYALPALVPMLAIGIIHISQSRTQRLHAFAWSIALALICVGLLWFAFTRLPEATTSVWNYINTPCLFLATKYLHFHNAWASIGLCFLILCSVLALAAWYSARAAVATFVLLNLLIAALAWTTFTLPMSRLYDKARHMEHVAEEFEDVTGSPLCLWLSRNLDPWHSIDMRWRIFPHVTSRGTNENKRCVRGVIDPLPNSEPGTSGMRLIATEHSPTDPRVVAGLFVETGTALDEWTRVKALPALDSFSPLPQTEWHADVELLDPTAIPVSVKSGSALDVDVIVTNRSMRSRWTAIQDGPYPIRLGARVTRDGSDQAVGEYRTSFATDLKPGESEVVKIRIGPLTEPGNYRARIAVVQELVAWFPGAREIEFHIERP